MNKKRINFLFYAFAFGWMGGHRYYLGPSWVAILYTLFFWTAVPAIVAYIEMIVYSVMSDEEFDRKYN